MNIKKTLALAGSLLLLASCGSGNPTSSNNSQNESSGSTQVISDSSSEETLPVSEESEVSSEEEEIAIKVVKLDCSNLEVSEGSGPLFVYVGKRYLVRVFAYGEDQKNPLNSDKIEYGLTGNEGTTVIDYVKVEQGEKSNEFYITANSKALTWGYFDLHGKARLKTDKIWSGVYEYSVAALEAPEAE